MKKLKKKYNHCIKKMPTIEEWSQAKEKFWIQESRLPFIRKLRILETMEPFDWEIDEGNPVYRVKGELQ